MITACSVLALTASVAHAQETGIRWRTDYAAARKEAEAKNLPIFIDFLKDACPPCERMDRETFSDPRVAGLISQRFIPLRVHLNANPGLVTQMSVNLFPTFVTASADGRILKREVAFKTADELQEMMHQTLAMLTPPDAMRQKFVAAVKLEKDGDYARALVYLREIIDDPEPRPSKRDAQTLMSKIEKLAADQFSQAADLHKKGKNLEAHEACTSILRRFPGVPTCRTAEDLMRLCVRNDAKVPVIERNKAARELLVQARDFYKTKDYMLAFDRCKKIIAEYGDLQEGHEAYLLNREICNNRECLQKVAAEMTDRLADVILALADNALKNSDVRLAQQYLQQVITTFPGSRAAESAQIRLNQLNGTVPASNVVRPGN